MVFQALTGGEYGFRPELIIDPGHRRVVLRRHRAAYHPLVDDSFDLKELPQFARAIVAGHLRYNLGGEVGEGYDDRLVCVRIDLAGVPIHSIEQTPIRAALNGGSVWRRAL